MIESSARAFSEVFAPEYFVLLCGLTVILYEWYATTAPRLRSLAARLGVFAVGWSVAFAIYKTGPTLVEPVPSWAPDFAGSLGLAVGIFVIWLVWHLREWGRLVPGFSLLLVAVTVPHLVVTPFWDVSSHVLYAATPAGYLALVDRRFVPYLVVPVGMVVSRPLAGAHTWPQSIAGLLLACVFLAGVWYGRVHSDPRDAAEEISDHSVKRI